MNFEIQNDFLKLTIASKGAEKQALISNNGVSYLRDLDEYWNRKAPFLFPNVGRLKDGYTIINNQEYHLPLHGFLRDQEFEVLHARKDEISLVNVYNEDTLNLYPFKYKAIITYQLKAKTLKTKVTIINEDDKDMIFNFGGHPGFRCPIFTDEKFTDYKVVFEKTENFAAPSVEEDGTLNFKKTTEFKDIKELPLKYDYFTIDAIVIPRVRSRKVKLVNDKNQGIEFKFPHFITLAIWTRPNAPFVCLEPWIGHADRYDANHQFSDKDNIITLKPLEEFKIHYDISVLE